MVQRIEEDDVEVLRKLEEVEVVSHIEEGKGNWFEILFHFNKNQFNPVFNSQMTFE
jgi:hypothetical protein